MEIENLNNYITKDFICFQLHAMSEVMTMFFAESLTLEECCKELNISNYKEMLALTQLMILINNFSEQKDENHNLTKNEFYIKDELNAFNFNGVKVLSGNTSPKQIIKEIRDGFEHKSYYIDTYGKIFINNKRTGFKAYVDTSFLTGSFFYYFNANNMNQYFLDDSKLNYNDPIEKVIEELKIYRIIAKQKSDVRNIDTFAKQDLKTLTKYFTFNSDYDYVPIILNEEEKRAIIDFFKYKKLNKENLHVILSIITASGPVLSNIINNFVFTNFMNLNNNSTKKAVNKYLKALDNKNIFDKRNNNILKYLFENNKFCQNYFKIIFIRYILCNIDFEMTEEDNHIRNCLSHAKYSWLNSNEILIKDHLNGINNEQNITFIKKYNIEELYQKAYNIWMETPSLTNKKVK